MKHLKTYESISISDLKRYVILKNLRLPTFIFLVEVIDKKQYKNAIHVLQLYHIDPSASGILCVDNDPWTDKDLDDIQMLDDFYREYEVILTNDRLDECLNYLMMLIDSDKYNL